MAELRADCSRRSRQPVPHARKALRGARTVTTGWRHLGEWAGYKMIGDGGAAWPVPLSWPASRRTCRRLD